MDRRAEVPTVGGGEHAPVTKDAQAPVVRREDSARQARHHARGKLDGCDGEIRGRDVQLQAFVRHEHVGRRCDGSRGAEEGGEPGEIVAGVLEGAADLELVLRWPPRSRFARP